MNTVQPLIDIIAGARPNFMKIAPIMRALKSRQAAGSRLRVRLVHTGQHYDERMSGDFFRQLGIPDPDVNLEVGSGTQAEQTAAIMVRYEQLLRQTRSDLCLVVGDVTSTMACAIAAQKLGVPVAHVEGGIRSGDWGMPEEINRLVTDAITNWFFTTSEVANANLRKAGVADERIFFVGNTMIDTLLANLPHLRPPGVLGRRRAAGRPVLRDDAASAGECRRQPGLRDICCAPWAKRCAACRWCSLCTRARPRRWPRCPAFQRACD